MDCLFQCGDGPAGLMAYPGTVQHAFVDVPYSEDVDAGNEAISVRENHFGFEPMTPELRKRISQALGAKVERWTLLMPGDDETHEWKQSLTAAGLNVFRIGQWIRGNTAPQFDGRGPAQGSEPIIIAHSRIGEQRWNGKGRPAIWHAPIVQGDDRVHPTQKPEQLLKQLIEDFSDPGETWTDLCAGSFVCGLVATALGRGFVGWDLDDTHVKLARERVKMPLFDANPLQAELFIARQSTRAATARAELDHEVFRLINGAGISRGEIAQKVTATKDELSRSLQRLRKGQLIFREGKTNDALYFRTSPHSLSSQPSTGDQHP